VSDTPNDIPLFADEGGTPFGSPVIDLAEMRIKFGRSDTKVGKPCEHRAVIYSRSERRVWCEDCERTIDTFDAFMTVVAHFHSMEAAAKAKLAAAKTAEALTINLRSAKVFDKAWRGPHQMAVACPHCRGGLLPEDFIHGGSQRSAELERARRAKTNTSKERPAE
jgi:hypothetical protein